MSERPILSIITVCFRDAKNLAATLESIKAVKQGGIEFVIVDGGSDDGTAELVQSYGELVDTFISEPDKGTFDAMNKGIRHSRGKWVIFINAGDGIADPAAFQSIKLTEYADAGLVYGNTVYAGRGEVKPYPEASLQYGLIMACHQSMLFNRDILGDDIFYSERFPLVNEFDLVCRIVAKKHLRMYIDIPVAYFMGGGISSRISWEARRARYFYVAQHFGFRGLIMTGLESLGWLSLPARRK
ncbi:glycosyltransferase [Neolewinella lacunae]|uniref:Glycosyltransferase n=2 Tax=Neolewinella lacunae TaxID=1517758 RepID=A0A923PP85_9BACT|nr:glycosyltransferase [Neolewinella lacunae]MBC6994162.1 glycosyltransferase [Neolewinella lacunae]MDN3636689.1 glycosyltransferase [Neolewinella lacunae]